MPPFSIVDAAAHRRNRQASFAFGFRYNSRWIASLGIIQVRWQAMNAGRARLCPQPVKRSWTEKIVDRQEQSCL
jgi:hypothetical protein